jgi:oligoendopeptidase F
MGVDQIYSSDMNYPLVKEMEVSIPYEEAQTLIIDALAPLGEEYGNNLRRAFDERWIDVYPADGKDGGAFSNGLYGVHPYVLLNYTDDYNSVSTLAHELGHAMHQYESAQNQKSDFTSEPTSFTSEVASTTNELLLADYMIKNAKSDQEKLYYLFSELTTLNATFFRQSMYSEFEDAMYNIVEDGGSLNADSLEALWIQMLQKYNGPDCALTEASGYGWSRIPHFYYNFYVYQYATSVAAACNISERIENGDEGAVRDYLEFLKSGDSGDGPALIGISGVDITSPALADALVARYNSLIDQIQELESAGQ